MLRPHAACSSVGHKNVCARRRARAVCVCVCRPGTSTASTPARSAAPNTTETESETEGMGRAEHPWNIGRRQARRACVRVCVCACAWAVEVGWWMCRRPRPPGVIIRRVLRIAYRACPSVSACAVKRRQAGRASGPHLASRLTPHVPRRPSRSLEHRGLLLPPNHGHGAREKSERASALRRGSARQPGDTPGSRPLLSP